MQAREAAVAEASEKLQEAQTAFAELQASFFDDPLALTPWMNTLFDTADMGLTTLVVGPGMWPASDAASLFTKKDGAEATEGIEKMLAVFRKRYVLERGPDILSVLLRITPNIFREGFSSEAIAARITRLMEIQGLDPEGESPGSLDAVEVGWWDFDRVSPVAVLQQLDKLCQDETETDAETGEVTIKVPKKIKALGVVNFPARAIAEAAQNGVNISFAHICCGLHNAHSALEILRVCTRYNIKVIADDGTMCGCVHEDFVNSPCPILEPHDHPTLHRTNFAAVVHAMGGWACVQKALVGIKVIADKHSVPMSVVMLRWQIDLGITPVVHISWEDPRDALSGVQSKRGNNAHAALFQRASFLDELDMKTLQSLYK